MTVDIGSNTLLHDTWNSGCMELGWGVIHMEVLWSNFGMMCGWMILSEGVQKIFLTWLHRNS